MESDIVERLRDDAEINEMDPAKLPSEWKILREAADEIDRLRAELSKKFEELAAAIKQRDEARRLYCVEMSRHSMNPTRFTPEWGANVFGWDCFAQQEGGGA